jgi:hypothetical protein
VPLGDGDFLGVFTAAMGVTTNGEREGEKHPACASNQLVLHAYTRKQRWTARMVT